MIRQNKPTIEQLKSQRKFFKRICEKQREKIDNVDVELIKKSYDEELSILKKDRMHLHDMISTIH